MATITKGYTFESGQVVTETNLNQLVDSATISNIATGDIANGAVTNIKIAAVDAGKVTTGTLSVDRIANNSLPLTKLAAGALPSAVTVNSDNITNLSIVDADIANAANINGSKFADGTIADTKLATISTAGKVANSATTATSANTASAIVARDGSGGFSATTLNATTRIGVNKSSPAQMIHVALSDFPGIALDATGEGTDEKICDIINNGGALELRLVNDAYNDAETAIKIERSGFNVAQQRFYTGSSVERMTIKSGGQLRFVPLYANPSNPEAGDVYYDGNVNTLYVYNGSTWVALH
jgi:hypothetical protein